MANGENEELEQRLVLLKEIAAELEAQAATREGISRENAAALLDAQRHLDYIKQQGEAHGRILAQLEKQKETAAEDKQKERIQEQIDKLNEVNEYWLANKEVIKNL